MARKSVGKKVSLSTRVMAYFGDLSASHILLSYFLSFGSVENLSKQLTAFFQGSFLFSFIPISSSLLSYFLLIYLATSLFRIYFTLLFGNSLFSMISGIYTKQKFLEKRVFGFFREVISIFVSPFIDLKFSNQKMYQRDFFVYFLVKLLIIPSFFILSLGSPLIQNFTLLDGIKLSEVIAKKEKLEHQSSFDSFQEYNSERFKFKSFSSLKNERFILYPDFEIFSVQNSRKVVPFLSVFDRENKDVFYFKTTKRIRFLDVIEKAESGNPLFAKYYPNLASILKSDRKLYETREFKIKRTKNLLIGSEVVKEIQLLIKDSFNIGHKTFFSHLLDRGPFFRGYVEFRKTISRLIKAGTSAEIDFIKLGNADFIRFTQHFDSKIEGGKKVIETLLPIGTHNAPVYELGWDDTLGSALTRNQFYQSFLALCDWYFDYTGFFSPPSLEAQITPFYIIDQFTNSQLDLRQREILEEYLYRFYYELARESLLDKNKKFYVQLGVNFERLKLVWDSQKEIYSKLFIEQMEELKNSFAIKNKDYFNL